MLMSEDGESITTPWFTLAQPNSFFGSNACHRIIQIGDRDLSSFGGLGGEVGHRPEGVGHLVSVPDGSGNEHREDRLFYDLEAERTTGLDGRDTADTFDPGI